ncbi:MAG: MOSC domain-containing protein [Gemmatimonadota bacterium]|nr:MOSC domain-containing protein [Gemmatimonadota bacterium]
MPARLRALGRVAFVNVSAGGVPKLSVREARLGPNGLEGDKQRNRRIHGGPMRALCVYSLERIRALQQEGHPIAPGTTGENITLEGIDWTLVAPGVRLALGDATIEITDFTEPCAVIRHSFSDHDPARVGQLEHPGWSRVYALVLEEGVVRAGDSARVLHDPAATA